MSQLIEEKSRGIHERCGRCGQSTSYLLAVDRGTTDIMKSIYTRVRLKGKNCVHPRNEMEVAVSGKLSYEQMVTDGKLTSNHVGNLSRPRFHGLIAKVRGMPGYYLITPKGGEFLRKASIPKYAIISKVERRQVGYWKENEHRVTIDDFRPEQEYWEAPPPREKPVEPVQREMEFINTYNEENTFRKSKGAAVHS